MIMIKQRCAFVLFLITLLFMSQVHWVWRVQRELLRHKFGLDTLNPLKEKSVPAGCPASCEWHILSHHPCTVFLACFGNYLSQKQIALLLYLKISSLAYVTINLHSNAISQLLTNWVNDGSYVSQWFCCCLSIKFFIRLVVSCGSWPTGISIARRSDDHARTRHHL